MQFTYDPQTDKKQIAALAPLVARAYEAGDEAAKAVVEKACRELALLVEPVARVLHMEDGVLALTGSILLRDKAVREGTAALLRMRFPGMRLAEPKSDAAAGAALLALETLNTEKGENNGRNRSIIACRRCAVCQEKEGKTKKCGSGIIFCAHVTTCRERTG